MKPTQLTELLSNIKATFVSFFSIMMFVALGVGIFAGISWTGPGLQRSADRAFEEGSFHNLQIQYPYGITDDDIKQLSQVEGVTDVEPLFVSYQRYSRDGVPYTLKVQSLSGQIDKPYIIEDGALPEKDGEIAVLSTWAKLIGLSVGDTITFAHDAGDVNLAALLSGSDSEEEVTGASSSDPDGMAYLKADSFKVVGIVDSAEYVATGSYTYGFSTIGSGTIDGIGWVLASAFDQKSFFDAYPVVNILSDSLAGLSSYSSEYQKASGELAGRVKEVGSPSASARFSSLHETAQKKVDEADKQVADAEKKIADGEKQISDGEKKIADVEKQIADGKAQLEAGKAELESKRAEGRQKLDAAKKLADKYQAQYDEAEAEYEKYRSVYDDVVSQAEAAKSDLNDAINKKAALDKQLADKKITLEKYKRELAKLVNQANSAINPFKKYAKNLPVITADNFDAATTTAKNIISDYGDVSVTVDGETLSLNKVRSELDKAGAKLASKKAELDAGWDKYHQAENTYNSMVAEGEAKVADGEAQLESARAQVKDGKAKIKESKKEVEDGKKELAEKSKQLDEAKKQVGDMKEFDWTVMERSYNGGYQTVDTFSGVTGRLRFTMAALFIIVGLLVCYSAVSRIVHEQITQIGTKKALGLREREITTSFLAYSAIAVIVGAIIGLVVGTFVVEGIIANALKPQFVMGAFPPYWSPALAVVVTLIELVLVLAATWFACHTILRQHAVELLKGEKPPEGKTRFFEKWAIWDKLPLYTQTIVNNCLNDKRRVFGTVVGVAGCTALIVTAITLNDDVLDSYAKHYQDVFGFDVIAYIDRSSDSSDKAGGDASSESGQATAPDAEMQAAMDVLSGEGCSSVPVYRAALSVELTSGSRTSARMTVPYDLAEFNKYYRVISANSAVDLSTSDGVWLTQAYAEHRGAKVGDEVALYDTAGEVHRLPIAGFYEYYLTNNEVVMGRELYEREFAKDVVPNALLVNSGGADFNGLQKSVIGKGNIASLDHDKLTNGAMFDSFSSVSRTVVLVYLALSALMAVVVLLNLNVMFIEEKKRDLIVLMINGFSVKDAKRYISNDTIVLTFLGILCGLILGSIMGIVTVSSIQPDTASFLKVVDWRSLLIGAGGSAILAAIMSVISLRRIPRFNLTDINKF